MRASDILGYPREKGIVVQKESKANSLIVSLLFLALLLNALLCSASQSLSDQVQEHLRNRIEAAGIPPEIVVGGEKIHASVALPRFYTNRFFRGAWIDDRGLKPLVTGFVNAIHDAAAEGLHPQDYHLDNIEELMEKIRRSEKEQPSPDPHVLADIDLLLTDAFLILGSHLISGRVNPESIDPEWIANRRGTDMTSILVKALESRQVAKSLKNLLPAQSGYFGLRDALSRYREIAKKGGWDEMPKGPKLQNGDRGERVQALRSRLIATGELSAVYGHSGDIFDEDIENAVKMFQSRNSLAADGIVGVATIAALNVSVEDRINQIRVNMERWRWLPEDLGRRHIIVNIANFILNVSENNRSVMTMRVVVGTKYRRTPVFSARMTYLVLSPYWHIPRKLALEDKIPLILKDIDYLDKQKIKVLEGWGADTKEVDPKTVDWTSASSGNFTFRLRQEPGPMNALGQIKFMFPNKFNVYLHDTPSREHFSQTVRTYSSGCIRIERPIDLAEYLLKSDPKWTREHIQGAIAENREQTVAIPEPLDVHLLYWTTWVENDGSVHFCNDIYKRDERLREALDRKSLDTSDSH